MTTIKEELRAASVDQLYKRGDDVPASSAEAYLSEILEYPDEVISCAMGDVGIRLRDFSKQIDQNHPEIGLVLKSLFADKDLSGKVCDYLKLAAFAVKENLGKVQLHRSALTKVPSALRSLDCSDKNQQLVRLVADRSLRDKIRGTKEVRPVEMRYLLKKGKVHWGQVPEDFDYYTRFSDAYKRDVEASKEKMGVYESLGCHAISRTVQMKVESFADHMQNSFCGFHRIKMSDAAAIAGKTFGAAVATSNYAEPTIRVPHQVVKNYLYLDPNGKYAPSKPSRHYRFIARAYPYVALEDIASNNMKRAIDHLENFPESNGRPLFDHYIVVVPSVHYPHEPNKIEARNASYVFKNGEETWEFQDPEECGQKLDRTMIQNGDSHPVVLGERDGECYFICYWI